MSVLLWINQILHFDMCTDTLPLTTLLDKFVSQVDHIRALMKKERKFPYRLHLRALLLNPTYYPHLTNFPVPSKPNDQHQH